MSYTMYMYIHDCNYVEPTTPDVCHHHIRVNMVLLYVTSQLPFI